MPESLEQKASSALVDLTEALVAFSADILEKNDITHPDWISIKEGILTRSWHFVEFCDNVQHLSTIAKRYADLFSSSAEQAKDSFSNLNKVALKIIKEYRNLKKTASQQEMFSPATLKAATALVCIVDHYLVYYNTHKNSALLKNATMLLQEVLKICEDKAFSEPQKLTGLMEKILIDHNATFLAERDKPLADLVNKILAALLTLMIQQTAFSSNEEAKAVVKVKISTEVAAGEPDLLSATVKTLDQRITELNEEKTRNLARISTLEIEIGKLQEQLKKSEAKSKEVIAKNSQIENSTKQHLNKVNAENQKLIAAQSSLQVEIDSLKKEVKKLQTEIGKLRGVIQTKTGEIAKNEEQIERLQSQLLAQAATISSLKQNNETKDKSIAELSTQVLRLELQQSAREKSLSENLESESNEVARLKEALAKQEQAYDALSREYKTLQSNHKFELTALANKYGAVIKNLKPNFDLDTLKPQQVYTASAHSPTLHKPKPPVVGAPRLPATFRSSAPVPQGEG